MAVIHGTIGTFDPTLEDWGSYTERLQQYFTANDVAEDKRKAILLSGWMYMWSSNLPPHA